MAILRPRQGRAASDPQTEAAATASMEAARWWARTRRSSGSGLAARGADSAPTEGGAAGADQEHRVRVRRRHGFVGNGRDGAAQQDPGGRLRRRHGDQQGHRQPHRRIRPGGHPSGPHPPGQAGHAVGDPRVGRQLPGERQVRRGRGAGAAGTNSDAPADGPSAPARRGHAPGPARHPSPQSEPSSSNPRTRSNERCCSSVDRPDGTAGPTRTMPSARAATCWSRRATSMRATSSRCTSGSGRCRPTWATCWRSRTAPTRPSR